MCGSERRDSGDLSAGGGRGKPTSISRTNPRTHAFVVVNRLTMTMTLAPRRVAMNKRAFRGKSLSPDKNMQLAPAPTHRLNGRAEVQFTISGLTKILALPPPPSICLVTQFTEAMDALQRPHRE